MTRKYEIVYIMDGSLEEAQVDEQLAAHQALLKNDENPEPVKNVNHWGKRTLTFPIRKHETGHYTVAQFETDPTLLGEFERALKLDSKVLRYLIVLNEGELPRKVELHGMRPDGDRLANVSAGTDAKVEGEKPDAEKEVSA